METGNKPSEPRCPLAKLQAQPMDTEKIKHDGWHIDGILVVSKDDKRLDWFEREVITKLGHKLYGKATI
jgi:hypothetical protein